MLHDAETAGGLLCSRLAWHIDSADDHGKQCQHHCVSAVKTLTTAPGPSGDVGVDRWPQCFSTG